MHSGWLNMLLLVTCFDIYAQAVAPMTDTRTSFAIPTGGAVLVSHHGAVCDGRHDDTAALQEAFTNEQSSSLPPNSTCVVVGQIVVDGIHHQMPSYARTIVDLNGATIRFTGDGGGICQKGLNGLLRISVPTTISNGNLIADNPAAGCIVNFSSNGSFPKGFTGQLRIDNLVFNATAANAKTVGFYTAFSGLWAVERSTFGSRLLQAINSGGGNEGKNTDETDTSVVSRNNFQRSSKSTVPLVYIFSPQAVTVADNTFELGPGIQIKGNGYGEVVTVQGNWFGDAAPAFWIDVEHVASASILNNFVYSNGQQYGTGISIKTFQTCLVSGNLLFNQNIAIDASCMQGSSFMSNNIQKAKIGLSVAGSNATIQGNVFAVSSGGTGISLRAVNSLVGPNGFWNGKIDCAHGGGSNTFLLSSASLMPSCLLNGKSASSTLGSDPNRQ